MFIEINEVNKQYSDKENRPVDVLKDINLSVEKGQFVSILGPSGCGKSTLLSIVAGLTKTTSGHIQIDGKTITKPGKDRGMVFQQAHYSPG